MHKVAEDLIGREYDVGDLFDFMICGLLGYDSVRKVRFFELSRKNLVCSTSVRTIQEKLRKTLEQEGDFSFKRLFNTLNPDKWSSRKIEKFERTARWDIRKSSAFSICRGSSLRSPPLKSGRGYYKLIKKAE
jgi:hypothetical protein